MLHRSRGRWELTCSGTFAVFSECIIDEIHNCSLVFPLTDKPTLLQSCVVHDAIFAGPRHPGSGGFLKLRSNAILGNTTGVK
nr:hypothetical protein CFP56_79617 [Quercus suber]